MWNREKYTRLTGGVGGEALEGTSSDAMQRRTNTIIILHDLERRVSEPPTLMMSMGLACVRT